MTVLKTVWLILGDTKNGDDRELHFAPIVMDEVKRFQEVGNALIFPSTEKPNQAMDIRKAWGKALRVAKIPAKDILNPDGSIKQEKFTFHCLRGKQRLNLSTFITKEHLTFPVANNYHIDNITHAI